jgi:putative serine protease PepD
VSAPPVTRVPGVRAGFRSAAPVGAGFRRTEEQPPKLSGFRAPDPEPEPPADAEPGTEPGPKDPQRRRWQLAIGGLAVVIILLAVVAFFLGKSSSGSTASSAPTTTSSSTSSAPSSLAPTDIYQQVAPSVVLITTSKGALGSGIVATDTGTILTANHVISGGGDITIVFSDGTKSPATVANSDPSTDIATLTPQTLPQVVVAATLGGNVAVGADVVAIGNPLGLQDSVSSGVVSGLNRTEKTQSGSLSGLIQFDAAVNPGSSGGPLLDDHGSVVGVVVSIADPGRDDAWAGIGFAVPIGAALAGGSGQGPGGGPQQ